MTELRCELQRIGADLDNAMELIQKDLRAAKHIVCKAASDLDLLDFSHASWELREIAKRYGNVADLIVLHPSGETTSMEREQGKEELMSLLCDCCTKARDHWGGCEGHEAVRVGGSCKNFTPTLKKVFGDGFKKDLKERGVLAIARDIVEACRFNGYPEAETRKMLALISKALGLQ